MYGHLGQGPDAATSSLADFLSSSYVTELPPRMDVDIEDLLSVRLLALHSFS